MPYTLIETLRQIDPYVQLNDGDTVATVASRIKSIDPKDLTQYTLDVDGVGRLVIYRLNLRGYPIKPAVFVEEKFGRSPYAHHARETTGHFGSSVTGYV